MVLPEMMETARTVIMIAHYQRQIHREYQYRIRQNRNPQDPGQKTDPSEMAKAKAETEIMMTRNRILQ